MLIVFSGLPGAGKSTLARKVARQLGAVYLRVDTVEAALLNAGHTGITVEGYAVEYAIAADNLSLGLSVVADCVNPVAETREAWAAVAAKSGVPLRNIEVTCSDESEYHRRLDKRWATPSAHTGRWSPANQPEFELYCARYQPWETPRQVIDTAHGTLEQHLEELLCGVAARP